MFVCVGLLTAVVASYFLLRTRPVYLIDFAVARPPDSWQTPKELFMARTRGCGRFTEETIVFQEKILARSGLGEQTHLPPAVTSVPPAISMAAARKEFEDIVFQAVRLALEKAGVHPHEVGVLVVNCSLFNPTPSTSSMIINHFKMRSSIISYSLGGMGCSASPIAIDLARQMLQLYPSTYALVVSTENITQNWYFGNDRSMLVPNCLFRCGASAMLLSNRRRDLWRAKYELLHCVRTHLGGRSDAYNCIFQAEDANKQQGVSLSKELMAVAGEALKANITTLGPLVLPLSEQLLFFANLVARKLGRLSGKRVKPYIPDFKLAFDHVCIHTGGRAVIDEIEKQLSLTPDTCSPSRCTLFRYGNISSPSIWYTLAFIESQRGVRRGDRIWQLGFGSGFKCNSAVWRAMRSINDKHPAWEGFDLGAALTYINSLVNHNRPAKPAAEATATSASKAA